MSSKQNAIAVAASVLVLLACQLSQEAVAESGETPSPGWLRLGKNNQFLGWLSDERKRNGSRPLRHDMRLEMTAQKHAAWMAKNGMASHTGKDGSSVRQRVGPKFTSAVESIACGHTWSPYSDWIKPGTDSRANMLGNYNVFGMGYAKGENGRVYWCAIFARTDTKPDENDRNRYYGRSKEEADRLRRLSEKQRLLDDKQRRREHRLEEHFRNLKKRQREEAQRQNEFWRRFHDAWKPTTSK